MTGDTMPAALAAMDQITAIMSDLFPPVAEVEKALLAAGASPELALAISSRFGINLVDLLQGRLK